MILTQPILPPPRQHKYGAKIGIYPLTFQHKRILQTPGMWLDDEIVAATQHLLSLQYPAVGGLQPPVVVTSLGMEPQTHEFVQVVNASNNHWIVLSTIGCQPSSINIYDSLNGYLPPSIKTAVGNLLMTTDKIITVTYVNVQYQIGASDCGLFALAFATSLCSGQDPATLRYEHKCVRQHLLQCITRQKMSTFPCNKASCEKSDSCSHGKDPCVLCLPLV